jgi:hypothetical protein
MSRSKRIEIFNRSSSPPIDKSHAANANTARLDDKASSTYVNSSLPLHHKIAIEAVDTYREKASPNPTIKAVSVCTRYKPYNGTNVKKHETASVSQRIQKLDFVTVISLASRFFSSPLLTYTRTKGWLG